MAVEIKVPNVGESIREVQIAQWRKRVGEHVERDEELVELETDKATVDLPAPEGGVLTEILKQPGEIVAVGEVIARLQPNGKETKAEKPAAKGKKPAAKEKATDEAAAPKQATEATPKATAAGSEAVSPEAEHAAKQNTTDKAPAPKPPAEAMPKAKAAGSEAASAETEHEAESQKPWIVPSARRALHKHGLKPDDVTPAAGAGGRITERDVLEHVRKHESQPADDGEHEPAGDPPAAAEPAPAAEASSAEGERVTPMSIIRRRIAERLVAAQQQAALLTTFNEIDMASVIDLRKRFQEAFQAKYGAKLGFMSFFVKAAIDALQQFPALNAEIRGTDIVYRDYFHVGIAIGGAKGLVVPVLRHAERMSFAEIELAIRDFAERAGQNKLRPQDLEGGTFTISNGGVYGSLLSTPIVNPPQSGVLGMHAIQDRPVAQQGQVVIRPMMYVALTYDHRLVDGREAVTFLRRIKEAIEDPARMLLEV